MAVGENGRIQESGGAREGRVVDSSGSLVGETSAKLESLPGAGRQASLAGSYPGFRVAGQASVEGVFTRADECQVVNVEDRDCPMERLQDEFGVDIVISHMNAWEFLSCTLKSEKDWDILFRVTYPGPHGVLWLKPVV